MDLMQICAKIWWHALQFACLVLFIHDSFISWLRWVYAKAVYTDKMISFSSKRPQVVGVVLESEEAQQQKHKIVELVQWLVDIGVQSVSLYDIEGVLKSDLDTFKSSLEKLLGRRRRIHCYYHEQVSPLNGEEDSVFDCGRYESKRLLASVDVHTSCHDNSEILSTDGRDDMTIEILSFSDGKEAMVMAARFLCLRAIQTDSPSRLTEEDVSDSLKAIGGAGPDPDLLLLCNNARCLFGFPPWRLRLTEILHMGSLRNMTQQSFMKILDEFSKKEHRYGK